MKYGSVCSGIEAASVAWEPLGWEPIWFSEIDPFPSAVLAHHWPQVPNLGDMTGIADLMLLGLVDAPEVLVGGTPCQAFSIAGNRESLDDERGQLTLAFVELANTIDEVRRYQGEEEAVVLWENVPGVLITRDNAFGCFLAGLAGEDEPLQPSGKKWSNAGIVSGPKRTAAWRILDAQYFGVAQRRRRVFLVASARKGFDPSAVLFESEGVRRDTPPRRETAQSPAGTLTARAGRSRGSGIEPEGVTVECFGGGSSAVEVSATLKSGQRLDFDSETFAVQPITGTLTASYGERTGRDLAEMPVAGAVSAGGGKPGQGFTAIQEGLSVRRLTPLECERLQGHHDNHTLISHGARRRVEAQMIAYYSRLLGRELTPKECAELAKDGPRYKAIGNSKAVPVVRWIGRRIQLEVERITNAHP